MKNIKNQISKIKYQKGFTLIELLVVIVIIGVLSSLLMVNFVGIRERARDTQRKSDLKQIQSALEMYRADQGSYPIAASLSQLVNCPVGSPTYFGNPTCTAIYMQKVPGDPLNTDQYISRYISSSDGLTYSLFACLENVNDSQKDASNNGTYCTGGSTNWSFTLQNP